MTRVGSGVRDLGNVLDIQGGGVPARLRVDLMAQPNALIGSDSRGSGGWLDRGRVFGHRSGGC